MLGNGYRGISRELSLFFVIVAITGLSMGMSDSVISNYFKDAYDVTAAQRGFLELPREGPGVICLFIIAATSAIGDVRMAIVAKSLSVVGALVLGLFTPSFAVMSLFIFINSLGNHIYIPLQESIGMSIIGRENLGRRMGQYGGIRTAFMMLANIIIFIGFKAGVFSFKTRIKIPFLLGSAGFAVVVALYILLLTRYKTSGEVRKSKFQIILRKEYSLYYVIAVMTGVHRQIMMVFAPWVLIEILGQGADTLSLLGIIASFLGAFLLPMVGRWIDRYGTKVILLSEGLVFMCVYLVYGFISGKMTLGVMAKVGLPFFIITGLYILDRLSMQMSIVRAAYLRSIALDPADITPTLSAGLSMDHVVSIVCALYGGIYWTKFGPQVVFYTAAALSLVNITASLLIKPQPKAAMSN